MKIKASFVIYVGAFILLLLIGLWGIPKEGVYISLENDVISGEKKVDYIYVHIEAPSKNRGVKKIEKGTRIFELIELSGGLIEEADVSRLNLSSVLKDEQKVLVPYKVIVEDGLYSENMQNGVSSQSVKNSLENTNKQININYATLEELEKLTGIGPSMANKIIEYRDENGYFNSIEEIMNVSGIGEGKFNKIKDEITV